mgnify:CR=1 FL=1
MSADTSISVKSPPGRRCEKGRREGCIIVYISTNAVSSRVVRTPASGFDAAARALHRDPCVAQRSVRRRLCQRQAIFSLTKIRYNFTNINSEPFGNLLDAKETHRYAQEGQKARRLCDSNTRPRKECLTLNSRASR